MMKNDRETIHVVFKCFDGHMLSALPVNEKHKYCETDNTQNTAWHRARLLLQIEHHGTPMQQIPVDKSLPDAVSTSAHQPANKSVQQGNLKCLDRSSTASQKNIAQRKNTHCSMALQRLHVHQLLCARYGQQQRHWTAQQKLCDTKYH